MYAKKYEAYTKRYHTSEYKSMKHSNNYIETETFEAKRSKKAKNASGTRF